MSKNLEDELDLPRGYKIIYDGIKDGKFIDPVISRNGMVAISFVGDYTPEHINKSAKRHQREMPSS